MFPIPAPKEAAMSSAAAPDIATSSASPPDVGKPALPVTRYLLDTNNHQRPHQAQAVGIAGRMDG